MSGFTLKEKEKLKRQLRNRELAEAVKRGESIAPLVSSQSLFFPPRPIIKKDDNALSFLFDKDSKPLPNS
jgi:hypothetical protein